MFAYTDSRVACGLSQSTVIRQVISRIDSLYGLCDCVRGSRLLRWQYLAARSSPTRHPPLPLSGATAAATATQCPLPPRLALRRWRHRALHVPAPLEAQRPNLRSPGSGAQFDRGVPVHRREPRASRVLPRRNSRLISAAPRSLPGPRLLAEYPPVNVFRDGMVMAALPNLPHGQGSAGVSPQSQPVGDSPASHKWSRLRCCRA